MPPKTTITAIFVVMADSNFGAVTADRALRSRLFRVRVGLRAQLQLITSISTFDRKKLNKNRRLRALRPP